MVITAHQSSYIPWAGLFHKISMADTFCFFDCVQYTKKDFVSRNWIKAQHGPQLLTIPVESKNHYETKLKDARIAHHNWERKHLKAIQLAYAKAPFYENYIDSIANFLTHRYTFLADLNTDIMIYILDSLGINVNLEWASRYDFQGTKSDLVLDMCKTLGASEYIFGEQGYNYADIPSFLENGIKLRFQKFEHPVYSQLHGAFLPNMSVIDLLFNVGPDSLKVITGDT